MQKAHQKQNSFGLPFGKPDKKHIPVLLSETLQYLDPSPGETYLDVTAGYGGHAAAVLERTLGAPATLVDRDKNAVDHLASSFQQNWVTICHEDFLSASQRLHRAGQHFDMILADLGVSSPHLNNHDRGFSLQTEGPLDMRMDESQELTASTIVNSYSEAELTEILLRYGEEPRARALAHRIVLARPLSTTTELAAIATTVWPAGKSRVHPATRLFQAIRIAVNDELGQLTQALEHWIELLNPGGRLVVISFHSLEDRIVKQKFQETGADSYDAVLRLLTKRPIMASSPEIVLNPRSRSAKLRAAVKINTKNKGR